MFDDRCDSFATVAPLEAQLPTGRHTLDRRLTLPAAVVPFGEDGRERLPKWTKFAPRDQ
jgi:hypothetical protein